jgi:hypothetical protein
LFQSLRAADQDADDQEIAGFDLVRQDAPEGRTLWIHDDEHGVVEAVIRFVLRLAEELDLTGLWGFQYALTCSLPRLDAFGCRLSSGGTSTSSRPRPATEVATTRIHHIG